MRFEMKSESRSYSRTRFPADILRNAKDHFLSKFAPKEAEITGVVMDVSLDSGGERGHDSEEEFFADYRANQGNSYFYVQLKTEHGQRSKFQVSVRGSSGYCDTAVEVVAPERSQALAAIDVFESCKDRYQLAAPPRKPAPKPAKPIIFIGHGGNDAWRDLKDHLHDKHGFEIDAYEIGARAGHAVRDILQSMLGRSSIAFLVMTAEDEMADGGVNPRLNVVHEAGLFQGRLGFNRGIVLLEEGATEFSNIKGIEQIRFKNIREVFGDVVATIRREFPHLE
jgi:hypothetical protein